MTANKNVTGYEQNHTRHTQNNAHSCTYAAQSNDPFITPYPGNLKLVSSYISSTQTTSVSSYSAHSQYTLHCTTHQQYLGDCTSQ